MSSYRKTNTWKTVDWATILLYLLMVAAGWFSICGASYQYETLNWLSLAGRHGNQLIWISLSFLLIFVIMMLDSNFYSVFANFFYILSVLLLIVTIFLAPEIKGSHSWLVVGPVRLQPAEFAKFATALAVANAMSSYGFKLTGLQNLLIVLTLIFLPMCCILLQKEMGSALVFTAFMFVLYRK